MKGKAEAAVDAGPPARLGIRMMTYRQNLFPSAYRESVTGPEDG